MMDLSDNVGRYQTTFVLVSLVADMTSDFGVNIFVKYYVSTNYHKNQNKSIAQLYQCVVKYAEDICPEKIHIFPSLS